MVSRFVVTFFVLFILPRARANLYEVRKTLSKETNYIINFHTHPIRKTVTYLVLCFELRMCTIYLHRTREKRYSANPFHKMVSSVKRFYIIDLALFVSDLKTGRSGNLLFKI